MNILVCDDANTIGATGGAVIAEVVREKPQAVLGLATGESPLSTYAWLANEVRTGSLDLTRASGFALDEYVGIPQCHPESYSAVISRHVTGPLHMDPSRVRVPDGCADDLEDSCAEYEAAITAAGGIDIQILGIGTNGHIGFNEPRTLPTSLTRCVLLAPETRAANARFFDRPEHVPSSAVTQGLGTILRARRILLVAHGTSKRDAVAAALEGPVTSTCPASFLQHHDDVTVVLDPAAAAGLSPAGRYPGRTIGHAVSGVGCRSIDVEPAQTPVAARAIHGPSREHNVGTTPWPEGGGDVRTFLGFSSAR